MKLRDFGDKKPVKPKKEPTVFHLDNEKREQELGKHINDLEARLQMAHKEITELVPFQSQYSEAFNALEAKNEAFTRLQTDFDLQIDSLDTLRAKIGELQHSKDQLDQLTIQYGSSTSEVENLKKVLNEGKNRENDLQNAVFTAKDAFSTSEERNYVLNGEFMQLQGAFTTIKSENDGLQNILTELKDKYMDMAIDNESLKLDCQRLSNENTSARLKIEELDSFQVQLGIWNKQLTTEEGVSSSKSSALEMKLKNSEIVITDMETYINSLLDDRDALIKLNDYYKFELKKPKFAASMGVVSKNMGMPTSKENIRTAYLGTGNLTMLKFAAKEEDDALTI